jgi:hypothetical protein
MDESVGACMALRAAVVVVFCDPLGSAHGAGVHLALSGVVRLNQKGGGVRRWASTHPLNTVAIRLRVFGIPFALCSDGGVPLAFHWP